MNIKFLLNESIIITNFPMIMCSDPQLVLEMEKQQTSTLSLQTCETLDLPDLPDPLEEEHKLIPT